MSVEFGKYKPIESNYAKGNLGEVSVQDAFRKLGYFVRVHRSWDKGVDVVALKITAAVKFDSSLVVGEVLNWSCKGYIHNQRFKSIVDSLMNCSTVERYLFAFGVCPTSRQKRLLHAYNIKLCYFKDSIKKITKSTVAKIVNAIDAVITQVSDSIGNCFASFIVGIFCCSSCATNEFEWWRRLRKKMFLRNFMVMGGFVS